MQPEILERRRADPFLVYTVWMELRLQKKATDTDRQSKAIQTVLKMHPARVAKLLKDMVHDGFLYTRRTEKKTEVYDIPDFDNKNVSILPYL